MVVGVQAVNTLVMEKYYNVVLLPEKLLLVTLHFGSSLGVIINHSFFPNLLRSNGKNTQKEAQDK